MKEPVFHIGYQKTGTTWLQTVVFPALPGVHFLGKHGLVKSSTFARFVGDLRSPDEGAPVPAWPVKHANEDSGPYLVSVEGFVGTPWIGGRDAPRIRERIHSLAPDARIVLTIRSQRTLLRSLYGQYVMAGGRSTIEDFLDVDAPDCEFSTEFLNFDATVAALEDTFGAARILVLPYEIMRASPSEAISQLCAFLDCERPDLSEDALSAQVRTGLTGGQMVVMRWLNLIRRSPLRPSNPYPNRWPPALRGLSPLSLAARYAALARRLGIDHDCRIVRAIEDVLASFEPSNLRLSEKLGLDLGALGYPVAKRSSNA